MDIKDFIVTPSYLILMLVISFFISQKVIRKPLRQYFILGISVRLFSAIAIGILYQFYYHGGDTYYYFYHSGIIWEALVNDPIVGLKILFGAEPEGEVYTYTSRMFWYNDPASLLVAKFGGIFDVLTFHTYGATAMFFSLFSFSGSWMFFTSIIKKYPGNTRSLAFAILFFPSSIFWGSGLLKDSLALGATFWLVYLIFKWIELKKFLFRDIFLFLGAFYLAITVKFYIVISLFPAILIWIARKRIGNIKSLIPRIMLAPLIFIAFVVTGFFAANSFVSSESKYSFNRLAETAAIASHDIGHVSGRESGSGYSFGRLDGTFSGMIKHAHRSISVALFRPFIWEARNPLMILASLESLTMLLIFVISVLKKRIFYNLRDPFLLGSFLFSILFAFAVGFTYNFGTLMRYRIPLLSFYLIPLLVNTRQTPVRISRKRICERKEIEHGYN